MPIRKKLLTKANERFNKKIDKNDDALNHLHHANWESEYLDLQRKRTKLFGKQDELVRLINTIPKKDLQKIIQDVKDAKKKKL
jgi:hypothetical protein